MDLFGTIKSYSVYDSVGRIVLDDGRELRFGATALRNMVAAVGLRVRVASTAPHPLGGLRALEIFPSVSAEEYQDKEKAFWTAAKAERNEWGEQAERDRPSFEWVKPDPLTPEERAVLDEDRRLREEAARASELHAIQLAEREREAARLLSTQTGIEVFTEILRRSGIASADVERLVARGEPAAKIVGSVGTTSVPRGASKLGGQPDLPANTAWPVFQGKPLAFLGQFRMPHVPAVVRRSLGLPDEGLLSFFFFETADQPFDYDPASRGMARVLFTREVSSLVKRAFPPALDADVRFRELVVDFGETFLPASPCSVHLDDLELDEATSDAYRDAYDAYISAVGGEHFLGGRPIPIQVSMEVECALLGHGVYMGGPRPSGWSEVDTAAIEATAATFRLLLQLGGDDLLGVQWDDAGCLYFLLPEEAIAAGRFDDGWCILQGS